MQRPRVGDVVQIRLPNGQYAYGRALRDASVAFYRQRSAEPGQPPIGSRDFEFTVGVYDDAFATWVVVGHDPSVTPDEDWPPPQKIQDPISASDFRIYHKGQMRPATAAECRQLETAAVWATNHIIDRMMGRVRSN